MERYLQTVGIAQPKRENNDNIHFHQPQRAEGELDWAVLSQGFARAISQLFLSRLKHILRAEEGEGSRRLEMSPFVLADVGCGSGMYGIAVLEAFPLATVYFFDTSEIVEKVRETIATKGEKTVLARAVFVAGDVKTTAALYVDTFDVVLLSAVLHDWNYDDGVAALKSLGQSAKTKLRKCILIVLDSIRNERPDRGDDGPDWTVASALTMLGETHHWVWSRKQLRSALALAGFSTLKITDVDVYAIRD